MAKSKNSKRKTSTITIRVSEETTYMIERLAKDFGLSLSETLRAIILMVYVMQYVPEDVRSNWDKYVDRIIKLIQEM